jgi:hypothetical protein
LGFLEADSSFSPSMIVTKFGPHTRIPARARAGNILL